jgi:hypothetical protein
MSNLTDDPCQTDHSRNIGRFLLKHKCKLEVHRHNLIPNYFIGECYELGWDNDKKAWYLEELFTDELSGNPFYDSMPRGEFDHLEEALLNLVIINLPS